MSFDWTHQFCLACDKQTDGTTYCSESCRLADYEKTSSTTSSGASSPSLNGPAHPWTFSKPTTSSNKFYLSPAYDFSVHSTSLAQQSATPRSSSTLAPLGHVLSTSSSHSSLSSMKSNASTGSETAQLSEKARRELLAYAISFESVRLQRRRSY